MRKVRPLGQVTGRKGSMPAVAYSSVRDLSDNELLNLRTPRRKISEPLAPSTILLGRQMTSLNASPSPSQSPILDIHHSPVNRRLSIPTRRRTSDPAVLSVPRPPPSISPLSRDASPNPKPRCSPKPQPSLAPTPATPPLLTVNAGVQADASADASLVQKWRQLEAEISVLQSNLAELQTNVNNCGLQAEEYKRLYEAELAAHERSKASQKDVEAAIKDVAARRQRMLVEHDSRVSGTKREFTIRTDGVRREHSQTLHSFAKKLLTLGACLPTKTTAVNERQSQLALLLKDKQTLLDEIDNLRERVGRMKLGKEEEELVEEGTGNLCEACERKVLDLERIKEECSRREERIAYLQQKIRLVETKVAKGKTQRIHSAQTLIGQRRA